MISWPSTDSFLEVLHVYEEQTSFQIIIQSTHQSCPCPCCGVMSSRSHSRYTRILQDLPTRGKSVSLLLVSRE
ncbi:transposase family protein [Peribacillus asahii]|uniref:transposase family protein n=1 Tax=Peribacillus asahii TaxID=228899 RepID=UPI0021FE615E|nr:transposase family protein [Peribacillus asahii]USK62408.1 transposase family protein [Peribacillus asahii]